MRLPGGPHSVPHLGRTWAGSGDRMPLTAEPGRKGVASTHDHFAVRRGTTARRRQGRALSCYQPPATTQVGNKAMRVTVCDPMPKVLCGWRRSHLLSSMLAVQRLAGRSRDPSSMGLRRSSIHGSVHLAWPRWRWRWMLSKQSSVTLERSCSTGRGCRITRGWRAEAASGSCRPRSAVLAKVRLNKQRARVRVGASEHGWMGGAMCIPRGRGRPYMTVAVSLAREDYTRVPRWRATARIVLFSRERPVSRIGQKKEKSTTCEPSMLQRSAWSRPTCGQRSACTSSPRRPRTRHWKWPG